MGPLLYNIYLDDLFMFVNDDEICNDADDTTIYACDNIVESIIETLESDALKIAEWFLNNCMKLNEDKCHLMIFGDKSNDISLNIGSVRIKESKEEKLDKTLRFKQQKVHLQGPFAKRLGKSYMLSRESLTFLTLNN